MLQYCKKCGVPKLWCEENFYWQANCDRFDYTCKICRVAYQRKQGKVYRKSTHGWAQKLVEAARHRAKKKCLPCDIDATWVLLNTPLICPILGIPLKRGEGKVHANSPTLDRIDNDKGYVIGNIQIISMKANTAKSNLNLEEIERLYLYLNAHSNLNTAA